ncbi:MAG: tetratricopeptide repeat protein [bacterium]|nr:tetratricopeptide repeat protein [bacterium]
MLVVILLLVLAAYILLKKPESSSKNALPDSISLKLDKLWRAAQEALIDKKYLRAEKILLTILRFDERNATAYNRLGIIYASQKNFEQAIECFEIAQSLESSPSSLHNVGLIYLETENYHKAALAFEQALELENNLPTRYIAYAKALENLGENKAAIKALERASELDGRPQILRSLGSLYLKEGNTEKAQEIKERLDLVRSDHKTIRKNRIENQQAVKRI